MGFLIIVHFDVFLHKLNNDRLCRLFSEELLVYLVSFWVLPLFVALLMSGCLDFILEDLIGVLVRYIYISGAVDNSVHSLP